ncbi:hypothetical protein EYF80_015915 [Liparis tanakae]|uniref:Uncharacterized protein n=1 Tax=Liparis tanakae TaxID=230148 RepID=A0A4Z2I7H2_9TELE|nr:hypothetical protein EYF80_015915 [Liparis tanakae]
MMSNSRDRTSTVGRMCWLWDVTSSEEGGEARAGVSCDVSRQDTEGMWTQQSRDTALQPGERQQKVQGGSSGTASRRLAASPEAASCGKALQLLLSIPPLPASSFPSVTSGDVAPSLGLRGPFLHRASAFPARHRCALPPDLFSISEENADFLSSVFEGKYMKKVEREF